MIGRGQSETKTTAAKTIKQSKNKAKVFQEFSYMVTHSVKQNDGKM
jgi:hypothetical protein